MAFTERQEYKLEIIPPYNIIQCRRADIVEKDGVEVGIAPITVMCAPLAMMYLKTVQNCNRLLLHCGRRK